MQNENSKTYPKRSKSSPTNKNEKSTTHTAKKDSKEEDLHLPAQAVSLGFPLQEVSPVAEEEPEHTISHLLIQTTFSPNSSLIWVVEDSVVWAVEWMMIYRLVEVEHEEDVLDREWVDLVV